MIVKYLSIFILMFVLMNECALAQHASIMIYPSPAGKEIRQTLFGANICWPMYTNNLDQKTQSADDFLALAPLAKQLGLSILRYPGGLWSDAYRWKRGIGPIEKRRRISQNGIYAKQMPFIGTDEFLRFCKAANMEAIITVNYGLSQYEPPEFAYQEAADWVEYCNAPNDGSNPGGGTDWAAIRAKNGHPKPYNVKYWEIGNEIYSHKPKQKWGHTDVETYARRCVGFANAMKAIDSTIKVGAVAYMKSGFVSPNDTIIGSRKKWNRTVLEISGKQLDFISPHLYSSAPGMRSGALIKNGVMEGSYTVKTPGQYRLEAIVGGKELLGEWSYFKLEVDNKTVAGFETKSRQPTSFTHNLQMTRGEHTIGIRFTNDRWIRGKGDRNLYIKGLKVRGPDGKESGINFLDAQDHILLSTSVIEKDRRILREMRKMIRQIVPEKADTFELSVSEWNIGGLDLMGTFSAAIHCAEKLMMMAEEDVESAMYWLLFNAVHYGRSELWFPSNDRMLPRPTAFVFQIFSHHSQDRFAYSEVSAPTLPPLKKPRKGWHKSGAALKVFSTVSANGKILGIVVINRNVNQQIEAAFYWPGFVAGGKASITTLSGKNLYDRNSGLTSMDNLRIKTISTETPVHPDGFKLVLQPMSVTGITVTRQH